MLLIDYRILVWLIRWGLDMVKIWTQEEEIKLRELYPRIITTDICSILNRTRGAIINKANGLGLRKPMCSRNLCNRKSRRKDFFIESYFEEINSHEKARILGLIWADGSVHTKDGHYNMSIQLQECDGYILEYIKNTLKSNRKLIFIKSRNINWQNTYILNLSSKYMNNSLAALNIVPNKTYAKLSPIVPQQYINSFVLGLFEGDGSIVINKNSPKIKIANNYETCSWLKDSISPILDIGGGVYKDTHSNSYSWAVHGRHQVIKIAKWMYKNIDINTVMLRKYNKFRENGII